MKTANKAPQPRPYIPLSLARKVSESNPITFENLFNLDYLTAVSLRQLNALNSDKESPTALYIQYFAAEQEEDQAEKTRIKNLINERKDSGDDRDRLTALSALFHARHLLEDKNVTVLQVANLSNSLRKYFPDNLLAYGEFLLGMAHLNAGRNQEADTEFRSSASKFSNAHQTHRELTSHIHRPTLSAADLMILRVAAERTQDHKSNGTVTFELARRAHSEGDQDAAQSFATSAASIFQLRFPDPRRLRIVRDFQLHLINKANSVVKKSRDQLRGLEAQLCKLLTNGNMTKFDLIEKLYGRVESAHELDAVDARLRSLIYRLNQKQAGLVVKIGNHYTIRHKTSQAKA